MCVADGASLRRRAETHAVALLDAALLAAAYFVLAIASLEMALQPHSITDVWFPNAAAIGVVATAPRSRWAGLLAAAALANFAANVLVRGEPLLSASFVPGNLCEIIVGAWLLVRTDLARRFADDGATFVAALVLGGAVPQLLGATIGAALLQWHGFATFGGTWLGWYIDSTLGATAILPFTLAWRNARRPVAWRQLSSPAALIFLLAVGAGVFLAFHTLPHPFVFLSLVLSASVFFVAPVATFGLCFVLVLVVCAGLDFDWIDARRYPTPMSNVFLFLPAAAAVLPAQLLAVVLQGMRRLQADTAALTMVGSDVAAVFDRRGVFRGVNSTYERYWARSRESLIGRSIEEGVDPRYAALVRQRFEHAMASAEPVKARNELDTALGPRVMDSRYQPVVDDRGQSSALLFTSHDVTALVAAQRDLERNVAQLRAANEGMQQFVRIASHDMREPLNTIVQFCDLIEADHERDLPPSAHLYFSHVRHSAQRMRTLLDDVLSFARLEHESEIQLRSVALPRVLDAVQRALASRVAERGAQLEIAPLPDVMGHESLLVLLFQNLLSNGIKFTPPRRAPQVRVASRDDGEFIVVTVADRGIGIAAEDQRELFVPFKRLHTRRQYDGTGLGLAICRRIVELMGGSIALESQPGVGTQLHVRLRRAAELTAPAGEPVA